MNEKNYQFERPIAVIDLETTGVDIEKDRIVALAVVYLEGNGKIERKHEQLINPQIPIPKDAIAIHGISDEMVKNQPSFSQVAPDLLKNLENCDIAGYNVENFDLPLLKNEFKRAGYDTVLTNVAIVDAMTIYHKNEKRDLAAAAKFYLKEDYTEAHNALNDAEITARVLLEQINHYNLPKTAKELDEYCHEKPDHFVDVEGKLILKNEVTVINFGKYKNQALHEVFANDPGYIDWILGSDFSEEVKEVLKHLKITSSSSDLE